MTYIIQRAESMMGLFVFLVLYCVIRSVDSPRPSWWYGAAIVSCSMGMASKTVMVVAPVLVLLYDRIFLSFSFRQAFRRRGWLYGGLAATYIFCTFLVHTGANLQTQSAGFGMKGITVWEYVRTQPAVVCHYLALTVWPGTLVLDYLWPIAWISRGMIFPCLVLGVFAGMTVWAWRKAPRASFLGLWFFIALAPTSSIVPLADIAFEHRMYLPLAAASALFVFGLWGLLMRIPRTAPWRAGVMCAVVLAAVTALTGRTILRNEDYGSAVTMWRDVVAKRPNNVRGHNNLAYTLIAQGKLDEAVGHLFRARDLCPTYAATYFNLGEIAVKRGKLPEAYHYYAQAAQLLPRYTGAHNGMGNVLAEQGKMEEAVACYQRAIQIQPDYAPAYYNLGVVFAKQNRWGDALSAYLRALEWKPDYPQAHNNAGNIFLRQGKIQQAISHYRQALAYDLACSQTHHNLALILAMQGQYDEAAVHFKAANVK